MHVPRHYRSATPPMWPALRDVDARPLPRRRGVTGGGNSLTRGTDRTCTATRATPSAGTPGSRGSLPRALRPSSRALRTRHSHGAAPWVARPPSDGSHGSAAAATASVRDRAAHQDATGFEVLRERYPGRYDLARGTLGECRGAARCDCSEAARSKGVLPNPPIIAAPHKRGLPFAV